MVWAKGRGRCAGSSLYRHAGPAGERPASRAARRAWRAGVTARRVFSDNARWTPSGPFMSIKKQSGGLGAMTLGALGVVYGDIGTSPLYTLHEIFLPPSGVPLDPHHLVGAVSTIFWGLMLVVTLKYVILILRAD